MCSDIKLNAEDLRHARAIDLEAATGLHATSFAAWSASRNISEKNLGIIAEALGMTKSEVLRGFELRREDVRAARIVAHKLNQLIEEAEGAA